MPLKESGEMYLESIYVLSKEKANVRSIDICEYMQFSKPSVSRAVNLLKNQSYITIDDNGYITLTDLGAKIAHKIYERHTILTNLLIKLGVSPKTAAVDACKLEHDLSDETFNAIKKYLV